METRKLVAWFIAFSLIVLSGCGGSSSNDNPLSDKDLNLIFVVSPDLNFQGQGDVDPNTANLTSQGLQRSLLMASFLKDKVLDGNNVKAVYALAPMTHLQTGNNYPDMAGLGYIQQFALLNKTTIQEITAYSHPIATSYGPGSVPSGVVKPSTFKGLAQGLAFDDVAGDNVALLTGIIDANVPGYYVFSSPWETTSTLLADINNSKGYGLDVPTSYTGPNSVYAISIAETGGATLHTFEGDLNPPTTYPDLPKPIKTAACNQQTSFNIVRQGGINQAVIPSNINRNATVYLMRHAEAHPGSPAWDDGNYIGSGQWRAIGLPEALRGKISPNQVYSIDPAQAFDLGDVELFSYIRPSLTVLPYVIANNLPYRLVASFELGGEKDPVAANNAKNFFFTGGKFSNQTVLVAWEHAHFPPLITTLIESYGGTDPAPTLTWPSADYDTIWTVKLDAQGNVTVDNTLCEGIDSESLPYEAPQF